jgi:hypothetical protein
MERQVRTPRENETVKPTNSLSRAEEGQVRIPGGSDKRGVLTDYGARGEVRVRMTRDGGTTRDTHLLLTAEGATSQDTKRTRDSDRHPLPVDHRKEG